MLVLTRRVGESIRIGDDVVVTLVQVGPGKVRLGIQAPGDTIILRDELAAHAAPPIVAVSTAGGNAAEVGGS